MRRRRLVVPRTIRPKKGRTRTTHLWSHVHDHLAELFIISRESLIFFSEMSRVLLQGHKLLRLGPWYRLELPLVETLWITRKFSAVVLKSSYTQFFSGLPDDLASIHKSGLKSEWVEGSSLYLSLNQLLYVSWKLKKKTSNSIQENNNLRKKIVEQTYHKVLSVVVDELLHPFLAVFTPYVRLNKKLHWAWLTSKRRSL